MSEQMPGIGSRREVGGRELWVDRAGAGEPTVVFIPGAGGFGLDFFRVHELAQRTTTSIIYDRAGSGWSETVELPRTLDDVTDELRMVLQTVGAQSPYLLVGHSLGGLYAQRYAQRFPTEVAAMLLLDPAHEDWDLYMPDELKMVNQTLSTDMPELPEAFVAQYREAFSNLFSDFPDRVRDVLVDRHFDPDRLVNGFREGSNVLGLFDELRGGGPRPDVPFVILSGAGTDATQHLLSNNDQLQQQIRGSRKLYDTIVARASQGEHRVLQDASHLTIPLARADAVNEALHDLIAVTRNTAQG